MAIPNRRADVQRIWEERGQPALLSEDAFADFTRLVAACFAFGVSTWGIDADPLWGVRRNSTGTISKDVLRYGDTGAVDIASNAGKPEWRFQWLTYGPESDHFGVGREPASRNDLPYLLPRALPRLTPEPPFPPPPHSTPDALLDRVLNDYAWYIRHVAGIDQAIADWHRDVTKKDATVSLFGHVHWRIGREHDRWEQALGAPLTLRKILQDMLPKTLTPTVALPKMIELADAPSLFSMHGARGNFLYPNDLYFPPHCWVESESTLRALLTWNKDHGYTLILAMLEQDDWGPSKGKALYTAHTAPRVRTGGTYDAYGWTHNLDELIRRITIARQEYGLEIVLSLWDQQRLAVDFDFALRNTKRIVQALNPYVCAFFNSWEMDEVVSQDRQHTLNAEIARWATKPSGPHFARPVPPIYWETDASTVLWHQQERHWSTGALAEDMTVTIERHAMVAVVAFEHSAGVRHSTYTHEESQTRAQANLDAGAFASLNG